MKYRPDIDGLRAIAVLSVVLCHAGITLPGGYVGVDVFFVISGYLIARRMLFEVQQGTFSLADFWERRIRRILPALFVVVVSTLVAGWFFLIPSNYEMLGRSLIHLMLLRSNIFFLKHTDYFASADELKPLLHTWSLSLEEQFYLLIPLLFWMAMRLRRQAWLGPIIGVLASVSFVYSVYGVSTWVQQAYFALSTRAWELLVGAIIALLAQRASRAAILQVSGSTREWAAGLSLAGIVLPCILYNTRTPFPGLAAIPPVLGTALLIAMGGSEDRATRSHRLLASWPLVNIGLISYSLYLWHWPLIVFLKSGRLWLETVSGRCFLIVVSTALAALTYRYVEIPFRHRNVLKTRARLIAATVCAVAGLLVAGQALRFSHGVMDRLSDKAQLYARTGVQDISWCRECRAEDVPHNLPRFGNSDAPPTLLIWGDSHAGCLMPVIHKMCLEAGVAGHLAMRPATPPIIHHGTQSSPAQIATANALGNSVIRFATSGEVEAVLIVGVWSAYFRQPQFDDTLIQTIDELRSASCRVYLMKDVPCYEFDVANSLVRYEWHGMDIGSLALSLQDYHDQNRGLERILPRLIERGVTILDPIPFLRARSQDNTIPICDADGAFYCDAHHLSPHGVRTIGPALTPMIDELAQLAARHEPSGISRPGPTANSRRVERR